MLIMLAGASMPPAPPFLLAGGAALVIGVVLVELAPLLPLATGLASVTGARLPPLASALLPLMAADGGRVVSASCAAFDISLPAEQAAASARRHNSASLGHDHARTLARSHSASPRIAPLHCQNRNMEPRKDSPRALADLAMNPGHRPRTAGSSIVECC
jgi:hypothetical protein